MENYPDLGATVKIIMQNGAEFQGYWDGERWYVGIGDNAYDAPIDVDLMAYWEYYV